MLPVHIYPLRWYNILYSMFDRMCKCTHTQRCMYVLNGTCHWICFMLFHANYVSLQVVEVVLDQARGECQALPPGTVLGKGLNPYPCLGSRREPFTSSLFCEDVDTCKPDPCIYIKEENIRSRN